MEEQAVLVQILQKAITKVELNTEGFYEGKYLCEGQQEGVQRRWGPLCLHVPPHLVTGGSSQWEAWPQCNPSTGAAAAARSLVTNAPHCLQQEVFLGSLSQPPCGK